MPDRVYLCRLGCGLAVEPPLRSCEACKALARERKAARYRERHLERLRAYNRQYFHDHKEARAAARRAWIAANPGRDKLARAAREEARDAGLPLNVVRERFGLPAC